MEVGPSVPGHGAYIDHSSLSGSNVPFPKRHPLEIAETIVINVAMGRQQRPSIVQKRRLKESQATDGPKDKRVQKREWRK